MHQLLHFLNKKTILILIFSIFICIAKWCVFVFSESNLEAKILFNYIADSKYWIPYIKFISELTLNYSYDPEIKNLNNLPIPIGSLFIYSIFYKIFGLHSLIIVEFFATFLFLLIFYKIFNRFCDENFSLFFSIFLISLPGIFEYINLDIWKIENILSNLYSLRIHRPVFSNVFFFGCIYFLIKEIQEKKINEKNILIFSFFLGLLFSSFYYFFIITFLSVSFVLLQKINFKIYNIKDHFPLIVKSLLIFIATSLPFILNLYFHENDVSKGAGLISLNIEKKILILKYFISNFTKIEFLIIFFVISVITFLLRKNVNHKIILLFYIIFVSSIISPIIFTILSPSSGLIYHFNNNVLLCIFLYTFILTCIFLKYTLKNNSKLLYFFITLFLSFNVYHNFSLSIDNQNYLNKDNRIEEFNIIQNNLKKDLKDKFNTKGLLTFDTNFMIWAILNDFKFINIINHMWTPKKYEMMEEDLIKNLKFLNLKDKDFEVFLKNNFQGWRYFNKNFGDLFGYRYQANSLVTRKNDEFENETINSFIKSSSPSLNQQIAITKKEKERLIYAFNKSENYNFRKPEVIIINLDKAFLENFYIDKSFYCLKFEGNFYQMYYLKSEVKCS